MGNPRCLLPTKELDDLAKKFPEETPKGIRILVGLWQDENNLKDNVYPSVEELASYIKKVRKDSNANLAQEATITYNLPGQKTQTYTIRGSHIYNSAGKEVFTEESKHRNRIFANLAVQQGRAVVVEHKGRKYVVNNKDAIISVATGDKMNWSENNGDRKAIVELAKAKFSSMRSNNPNQPIQTTASSNSNLVITGDSRSTAQKAKELGGIDTLRHPDANGMHFGNPFSHADYKGAIKVGTVKEAVIAYEQWLRGEKYQDVEPERRQWILNQINNGSLVGKPLVYYTDKIPDNSYGRATYDPVTAPNHAHILQKLINEVGPKSQMNANPAELSEAQTRDSIDSAEEAERNKKLNIEDVIDDNIPLSIEDIDMVDTIFEPKTRRQRVSLIASLFSSEVDKALENHRNQLNALIDKATREGNVDELNQYKAQLEELSREKIIDTLTPGQIFKNIYKTFADFVNDTEEHRVEAELIQLNLRDRNNRYSKDYKKALAKKKATHKLQEFKKMIDNPMVFKALCEDSSRILLVTEGLQIDINRDYVEKLNLIEEDPEGRSFIDEETGESKIEEAVKDGWMTNYKHISSKDSLSQEVRAVIRTIPQLNYKGKYDLDDLGIQKYLDANYVHATLIDALRYMVTSDDMIPALKKLAKQKPWVKQIIKKLEESKAGDSVLFSKFYQNYRKDFINYWVQKKITNPDGTVIMQTFCINRPENITYLLNDWRYNYESGYQLSEHSIYNVNGSLNPRKAERGLKLIGKIQTELKNLGSTDARIAELQKKDSTLFKSIEDALSRVGIKIDKRTLLIALTTETEGDTDNVTKVCEALNIIFSGVKNKRVSRDTNADGTIAKGDLINSFSKPYTTIAGVIKTAMDDAIESSVRENNKQYYSHVNPCYLGKLIKQLKNFQGTKKQLQEFLDENFKKYDWFYDQENKRWRHYWLEQIEKNGDARELLDHKVVLHSGKVEYPKLDSLDYTLALLTEYWSDPNERSAWYYVSILSDAPSAEFIRFTRITSGSDLSNTNRKFDDIILDKLEDLVLQEYDRICLISERDRKRLAGEKVEFIPNYDIQRKGDTIISKGGAEFKFLPGLNEFKDEDGTPFLEKIEELKNDPKGDLKSFIRKAVKQVMDNEFEAAYKSWIQVGLLDEIEGGKYKYLTKFDETRTTINGKILSALDAAEKALGSEWTEEMASLKNIIENNQSYNTQEAQSIIEKIKKLLGEEVRNNIIYNELSLKDPAKEALREYFWNNALATSQIIELTTTDLAFYKNIEDFQKRYKEVHAPSLRLNTKSKYGREFEKTIYISDQLISSTVGAEIESIVLSMYKEGKFTDVQAASIIAKYGVSNYKDTNGKSYYKVGRAIIPTEKINVTDGQAFRSLSSMRAVLDMSGEWTDEMERAYNNIKEGIFDYRDLEIMWNSKKPFVYTQISKLVGYETKLVKKVNSRGEVELDEYGNPKYEYIEDKTKPIYAKMPVQHKNSEFLLLAAHAMIAGKLGKSSRLVAINKFMEDNKIDVVQFKSAVKVGAQGVIDLNGIEDKNIIKHLETETGIKGKLNENRVHIISYEDYGIQTATPIHHIDTTQLFGTQLRKLITADMSPDAIIEVNGQKKTKQEWLNLYNELITENIIDSFSEINEIFRDPKKVEELLLNEIRSSTRYSKELERACTLDPKTGKFNIPLFDPIQSLRIQQLLNSILKNRITKQKIKGGSLIQVTSYGLTEDLQIVFKDKNGNILNFEKYKESHPKATKQQYDSFVSNAIAEGELSIAYYEAYMPAYSEEFVKHLIDPETHQLDVNKLPDSLRKLIGYRIPTEDKYSMIPIYIKGFTPQQNGGVIMLPAEITTITGSDFDIDKLYIMLPEFRTTQKYDLSTAWRDFYNDPANADINDEIKRNISEAFEHYKEKHPEDDFSDGFDENDYFQWLKEDYNKKKYEFSKIAQDRFSEWFKERKDKYRKGNVQFEKREYDDSKAAKDNSRAARNNMLLDMIWGVLTNKDTASKMLNPGGFDNIKKVDRILTIINNATSKELENLVDWYCLAHNIPTNQVFERITAKGSMTVPKPKAAYLFDMDFDVLDEYAQEYKGRLNPLSPTTQVYLHKQNMTGNQLISIFANHNANHALLQHTDVELSPSGTFKLNGKELTSLHSITNDKGEIISKNNASFLAAAVDNVKDPILATLQLDTFTADSAMLLSRLGYSPLEIGLLLNQPIIKEIIQTISRERRNGKDVNTIIDKVISKYSDKAKLTSDLTYDKVSNDFKIEDLALNITLGNDIANNVKNDATLFFYQGQVDVGFLFKRIYKSADALSKLAQAIKADTQNGGAGPSIAATEIKIGKLEEVLESSSNPKYPLSNVDVLYTDIFEDLDITDSDNIDTIRKRLLVSKLPYVQAFYSLGLEATNKLFKPYFPQLNDNFRLVIKRFKEMTKYNSLDEKTINNIYNDLFAYIMSKSIKFSDTVFTDPNTGEQNTLTGRDKRYWFINRFPKRFKEIVDSNPDIAEIPFIQKLSIQGANEHNPVDTIVFRNVGSLTTDLREEYARDWAALLHLKNPKAHRLAINLLQYCFYRNGFAFGPNTFVHLAPIMLRKVFPEYLETLESILNDTDTYSSFIDQYIYNHLNNRKLVPEIKGNSKTDVDFDVDFDVNFKDENNEFKDTIEVTWTNEYTNKSFVKKIITFDGGISADCYEYIARTEGSETVYYKLDTSVDSGSVLVGDSLSELKAVYKKITPLGFKNSFIEYEYGKSVEEIESVLKANEANYDPYKSAAALYEDEDTEESSGDNSYDESEINAYVDYLESVLDNMQQLGYDTSTMNDTGAEDNGVIKQATENDVRNFSDEEGNPACKK